MKAKTRIALPIAASAIMLAGCTGNQQAQDTSIPGESQMGAYLMVYHKDQDHSLHMAISYDSHTWTALNNDQAVIWGDTIATQHGIRDPHIFRGPDGGFCLAMTDLHIFSSKQHHERMMSDTSGRFKMREISEYRDTPFDRSQEDYGWGNNKGLVLMKSFDLIHWTKTNLDFSALSTPTGIKDTITGQDYPWSEAGCIWAPEMVYDSEAGHILMHFTSRMRTCHECIYYVYMNDEFSKMLSEPKILFKAPDNEKGLPSYTVIDSDVIHAKGMYHLFYVNHQGPATVKHASSQAATGPYIQDSKYDDHDPEIHEAPNCWKRIGKDEWVIMYDNYHRFPPNFGFVETKDFETFTPLGYFDEEGAGMTRTNFSAQKHAAVVQITLEEAKKLEEYWSNK